MVISLKVVTGIWIVRVVSSTIGSMFSFMAVFYD